MSATSPVTPEQATSGSASASPERINPAERTTPARAGAEQSAPAITQWIGLAANVGGLIGLILVVLQLQQNRELTRAQIRHELSAGIVDLLQVPAANAQLASVLRRAEQGETLTPDEAYQFRLRSNALLRYWEDVHYQYRQGLYAEEEFARQRQAWATSISRSIGLARYWCTVRTLYSPLFAAELDALLPPNACPAR